MRYLGYLRLILFCTMRWVAVASQAFAMILRQRATHKFYWTRR